MAGVPALPSNLMATVITRPHDVGGAVKVHPPASLVTSSWWHRFMPADRNANAGINNMLQVKCRLGAIIGHALSSSISARTSALSSTITGVDSVYHSEVERPRHQIPYLPALSVAFTVNVVIIRQ